MQLSKRLRAVADYVTPGSVVADIGCDHAHTSIYLIQNHIAKAVIALDINVGPLERARENISKYHLEEKIQTRRSDGAQKLKTGEADTLLISGMGGALMVRILQDSLAVVKSAKELILQPQSEINLVRKFLWQQGYSVIEENMLLEEGKYYVIIKAVSKEEKEQEEVFFWYGKPLLKSKNPVLQEYLIKKEQKVNSILRELQSNYAEKNVMRIRELEEELELIRKGLKYFNLM